MGEVILFPPERRLGFIRRQASAVVSYRPEGRERTLDHQLARQREWLTRIGIGPEEAADYVAALRTEIVARLPGGRRRA